MSIRIEKKTVVYESVSGVSIEPDTVFTDEDEVKEYLKKNTFPGTEQYTEEDLLADTQSSGAWWLPDEITEEQESYIAEMTYSFL
jgi:hypothetical protein